MSNEYKEWLQDRAVEALWNANVIDRIETTKIQGNGRCEITGYYHKVPVSFIVWLDDNENWKFERKELNT